jgi:predicted Fe-Mo cluster-binding NifX family protein
MSKIVIPVKDDLLSRSFNSCKYFLIYEVTDKKVVSKKVNFFPADFKANISEWPDHLGITDVIVHSIDEASLDLLTSTKINLFVGVKITGPDRLVEDFFDGTLKSDTNNAVEKCPSGSLTFKDSSSFAMKR